MTYGSIDCDYDENGAAQHPFQRNSAAVQGKSNRGFLLVLVAVVIFGATILSLRDRRSPSVSPVTTLNSTPDVLRMPADKAIVKNEEVAFVCHVELHPKTTQLFLYSHSASARRAPVLLGSTSLNVATYDGVKFPATSSEKDFAMKRTKKMLFPVVRIMKRKVPESTSSLLYGTVRFVAADGSSSSSPSSTGTTTTLAGKGNAFNNLTNILSGILTGAQAALAENGFTPQNLVDMAKNKTLEYNAFLNNVTALEIARVKGVADEGIRRVEATIAKEEEAITKSLKDEAVLIRKEMEALLPVNSTSSDETLSKAENENPDI